MFPGTISLRISLAEKDRVLLSLHCPLPLTPSGMDALTPVLELVSCFYFRIRRIAFIFTRLFRLPSSFVFSSGYVSPTVSRACSTLLIIMFMFIGSNM